MRLFTLRGPFAMRRYFILLTAIASLPLLIYIYLARSEHNAKTTGHVTKVPESIRVVTTPDHGSKVKPTDPDAARRERQSAVLANSMESMENFLSNGTMIEIRFAHRNRRLMQLCLKYGLDRTNEKRDYIPNPYNFIVVPNPAIVWCPVFKAASTTWLYKFNIIDGFPAKFIENTDIDRIQLTRTMHPSVSIYELHSALNTSVSFIIVRHPFERLASGYCDKLASPNKYYNKVLGLPIIKNYRKLGYVPRDPQYPTFPEFIDWFNDLARENKPIDEHFAATTTYCTPCLTPFDYILKVETLKQDEKFLLNAIGWPKLVSSNRHNPSKCANLESEKLFSQLTIHQLKRLYKYYRYDFELFDYSATEYFDMAN